MYLWQDYQDFTLRRMFKKYSELGVSALPEDKYKVSKILSKISSVL